MSTKKIDISQLTEQELIDALAQKKNKKDQDGENNEESDEELGDEDSQDDFGFKNLNNL